MLRLFSENNSLTNNACHTGFMLPSWFAWPFRIIIYSIAIVLSFTVIVPMIDSRNLGILISAPIAGIAIGLDVLVTAKLRKVSIQSEAARRVIIVDSVLSTEPKELEGADQQAIEKEKARLPKPKDD